VVLYLDNYCRDSEKVRIELLIQRSKINR